MAVFSLQTHCCVENCTKTVYRLIFVELFEKSQAPLMLTALLLLPLVRFFDTATTILPLHYEGITGITQTMTFTCKRS